METIDPRDRVLRVAPNANEATGSAVIAVETTHRTYQVMAHIVEAVRHVAP